ncbi:MAG: polysaccharide biosynthesis C-terminal domain-containing protein, partial [Gaiellaceae bacterium]
YYVGYSIGSVVIFVVFALDKAITPLIMAELKANGDSPRVQRLGTYCFGAIAFCSLVVGIYGGDALEAFAPDRYSRAAGIVPIIALASAVYGIYTIVVSGTWYSLRTGSIPLVTAAAAAVNLGLNLLLIPHFGIKAAAWNTVAGFAALALLQGLLAARRYRISWEYRRWTVLSAVALGSYLALEAAAPGVGVRRYALGVIALAAVPLVLTAVGFWTREERQWLQRRLPDAISWPGWTK